MVGQENRIGSVGDVFSVTRRSGFEVTTHSALLCDLLDPRGSHGQGGAFLKAFLEIVDGNLPPDVVGSAWPPADGWWRVTAECRTEEGRLDIILANRGPSGPATIAIENKWNAGLGKQQLERYGEYLTKLRRFRTVAPDVSGLSYPGRRKLPNTIPRRRHLPQLLRAHFEIDTKRS
jgi:PD-(D/E)XK nuclease superfamily